MHICHMLNSNEWGGVEHHTMRLIELSRQQNITISVFCTLSIFTKIKIKLHGCSGVSIYPYAPGPRPAFMQFIRFVSVLKHINPDILHCQLYSATRVGAPAAWLAGIPTIVETIHMEDNWRKGVKKIFNFLDWGIGKLFVSKYCAVSNSVANHYRVNKNITPEKITVIHNALNGEVSIQKPIHTPMVTFGFLGRLVHQKGIDVFLKAIAVLKKSSRQFRVTIAGAGEEQKNLKSLCEQMGLNRVVTFVGEVSDTDRFYKSIDIFVLPSRFEGFPLVLLEAGAKCKPVIASCVSGNPEIILNNNTGQLFESENHRELALKMSMYMDDLAKAQKHGKNLGCLIKRAFNEKIYMNEMNSFYWSCYENISNQQPVTLS